MHIDYLVTIIIVIIIVYIGIIFYSEQKGQKKLEIFKNQIIKRDKIRLIFEKWSILSKFSYSDITYKKDDITFTNELKKKIEDKIGAPIFNQDKIQGDELDDDDLYSIFQNKAANNLIFKDLKPTTLKNNDIAHISITIFVIFSLCLVVTVDKDYLPSNIVTSALDLNGTKILVTRESPVMVSAYNMLHNKTVTLDFIIYYDRQFGNIESIVISPSKKSILSFVNNELEEKIDKKKNENKINNSNLVNNINKTQNPINVINNNTRNLMQESYFKKEYYIDAVVRYNGIKQNLTESFDILITYEDGKTFTKSNAFDISVLVIDLPILTYFFIVLLGVILGRTITILAQKLQNNEYNVGHLHNEEKLWIAFSIIISIIGFSAFNSTITQFTNNVLANISIAFGFGFSSEKILELARSFTTKYRSAEESFQNK